MSARRRARSASTPPPNGHPAQRAAYEPVERVLRPTPYDPDMRRPASTVAGALLVLVGAVVGIVGIADLTLNWKTYAATVALEVDGLDVTPDILDISLAVVVAILAFAVLVELTCAFFILRGGNLSRVIVLSVSAVSIVTAFGGWWAQGQRITLESTLPSLAIDILVLLALSSRSAAAYARRNQRH